MEFFDVFSELSPEQRAAIEKEGGDLREIKRLEPLADATRQNSTPTMLLALLRTHPFQGIKLLVRFFWPAALGLLFGCVLLWQGETTLAALFLLGAVANVVHVLVLRGRPPR